MKIVHICLACFYIEGYGYQENILPQFHKDMGNDVTIITTEFEYDRKNQKKLRTSLDYINDYGIRVRTVKQSKRYCYYSKFGDFPMLYTLLHEEKPNIIFVHGGQFISLKYVIKYCKRNKHVRFFIDQHGDYYNMNIKNIKNKIIQYFIYGRYMRKAVKYVDKFWGVTPWRSQYLHDVYKIPENKIGLLVMGGDDRYIDFENKENIRNSIRSKYNIDTESFLIVTGGKIEKEKNIHFLIQAFLESNITNIKLMVFGKVEESFKEIMDPLLKKTGIISVGWIASNEVYKYFLSADLGVFPGTHSVLWEQACSTGLPCIFKYWEGMTHVNVCKNVEFLYNDSVDEIKNKIIDLYNSKGKYEILKKNAKIAAKSFLYSEIAKKSIDVN